MKHTRSTESHFDAFTLLEMMVVLLIIALIIGSVAVMVQGFENKGQDVAAGAKIKALESALTAYKITNLVYPTQEQGIEALVSPPSGEPRPRRWSQLLKSEALIDPWGRKIAYRNPGKHNAGGYDVFSSGPDGVENTGDDIGNW